MSKLSSCNLTPDPKEVKSMSGVFRQNSDKSSVYSDAATGDTVPLPIIISTRIYQPLCLHAHSMSLSHFRVHAYIMLVQLNLPIMQLQWTTIFFCCRQVLFHTGTWS